MSNRKKKEANTGCEMGRIVSLTQETDTHLCFWVIWEGACYGLPEQNQTHFAQRKCSELQKNV